MLLSHIKKHFGNELREKLLWFRSENGKPEPKMVYTLRGVTYYDERKIKAIYAHEIVQKLRKENK